MDAPTLDELTERLGIVPREPELIRQAFVHSSYFNENPDPVAGHNERLEFYGDAVIGLIVSRLLYDRYPDEDEGFLTARRAALVNRDALASLALDIGLDRYLLLGRGESEAGGATRPSLLAACFEALAGAISLSEGPERPSACWRALRAAARGAGRDRGPAEVGEVAAPGVDPAPPWRQARVPARRTTGPPHEQEFRVAVMLDGRASHGVGLEPAAGGGAGRHATRWSCSTRTTRRRATMSRLKELRLHGFKSFADPTRFVFEPGVNAVIGPNGSGKSNMADAVRWVLGEQSNRSLRTRRADDVIFARVRAAQAAGHGRGDPDARQRRRLAADRVRRGLDRASGVSVRRQRVPHQRCARSPARRRRAARRGPARRQRARRGGAGDGGRGALAAAGGAPPAVRGGGRRQGPPGQAQRGFGAAGARRATTSRASATSWPSSSRRSDALRCRPSTSSSTTRSGRGRARWSSRRTGGVSRPRERLGEARRAAAAAEAALAAYREAAGRRPAAIAAAEERYWQAEEAAREAAAAPRGDAGGAHPWRGSSRGASTTRLRELVGAARARRATSSTRSGAPRPSTTARRRGRRPGARAAAARPRAPGASVAELAAADEALLAAEQAVAELRAGQSDRIAARARAHEEAERQRDAARAGGARAVRGRRRARRAARRRRGGRAAALAQASGDAAAALAALDARGRGARRGAGGGRRDAPARRRDRRATPGNSRRAGRRSPSRTTRPPARPSAGDGGLAIAARRGRGTRGLVARDRGRRRR